MNGQGRPGADRCWSFEQRLAWRIGTVLLLASLALLVILCAFRALHVDAGVLGYGVFAVAWVSMIAALFAFAALVDSIVRRAPQCQFLAEIAIDLAIAVAGTWLLGNFIISGH